MTLFIDAQGKLNSVAHANCLNCFGEGMRFVQEYSEGRYSCRYEPCDCIEVIPVAAPVPE